MPFGQQVPAVTAGEVPADGLLLDVREPDEWAAGHVEGAFHVPMGEFVARFGEVAERAGDERVFVMCRVGGRSARVTQYLVQQGFDAVNIDGGMLAWDAANRPMTSDSGDPFVL
ncbi:rhodanese-like domain-containing protein [Streptomyces sp. P38-E01]|uniref:Rhodanese-like domain-containing protein n=1 Tax=Streptomyces tardus TaxID=2780544 RepID=A0A949JKH6_9ACTN|nr:rhodanese-like domain-containing protein [Streptomyces tardus]MBU7597879.1 rhodanese-like domain-containing protein [Streptomyces tardus]